MEIRINGDKASFGAQAATVGETVGTLDGNLESAGQAIVSLRLDGKPVPPEDIGGLGDIRTGDARLLELETESILSVKSKAVLAFLGILDGAAAAAGESADVWAGISADLKAFHDSLGGLFSAEETSFIEYFSTLLPKPGSRPSDPAALADMVEKLALVFRERRDELSDPAGAMAAAERLFEQRKPDILEVPVRLQTGRDAEAMHTLSFLIELINKTVRVLPSLAASGIDLSSLAIGPLGLNDFFAGFNASLRELMEAFERKDIILIGDLAEYELVPKLEAFFRSFRGPLGPGDPS